MASALSHAVAAFGIAACFYKPSTPKHIWLIGAACSVIPDLDTIGFRFGVRYADFWGHRGFTHSLVFAVLLAGAIVAIAFRHGVTGMGQFSLWLYFFLATASHAFLDALTDGGLGVAFFSPFNNHRFFFPWRPIRVSPISVSRFFTQRGLIVLKSELVWIWLPVLLLIVISLLVRRNEAPKTQKPS